jgi:hypothetical protein
VNNGLSGPCHLFLRDEAMNSGLSYEFAMDYVIRLGCWFDANYYSLLLLELCFTAKCCELK